MGTPTSSNGQLDSRTRAVAIGLVVVFVFAIVVLGLLRSDGQWDRLIYLFGGLEALVFAGAGALFGTTVQRGAVVSAREDAIHARQDADQARHEAKGAEADAINGRALAATVKAVGDSSPAEGDRRIGGRPDDAAGVSPALPLGALADVARRLFPD